MPLGAFKAALMGTAGVSTGPSAPYVVLLASNSADTTDLANISFTSGIDSTYGEYIFKFYNINPATDKTKLLFQGSIDGGSNYGVTMTSTHFYRGHDEQGSNAGTGGYQTSLDLAQSTDFMSLIEQAGNDADCSISGELHLFNPSSTTYVKHWYSKLNYMHSSGDSPSRPYSFISYCGGYFNDADDNIDAVQFKMSSGNLDGLIKMWGVK